MKKRSRELNPRKQTLISTLSQCSAPSLIKHLASCNDTVRFQSLRLLQTCLSTTSEISEIGSDLDMKKLWKGLFYCLWHCDKAPAQSDLINRLASFLTSLDTALSVEYFRGFVVTMRREWSGIDHLRLDKFYLCIRRFVKAVFGLLGRRGWDLGLLGEFVGVLEEDLFFGEERLGGNGVGYHVVGVWMDELRGSFVPVRREVVELVFRPFFGVLEKGLDKVLIGKVRGLVFEELVRVGKGLVERKRGGGGGGEEDGYDDLAFGLIAMKMGFAERFYEIGSSADCVQGNRKVVLKLHEEFVKLEKMLESSGVELQVPDVVVVENDDEEVPELVPIEGVVAANGEGEEGEDMLDDEDDARKHKKARKESDGRIKKTKKKKRKEKNSQILEEDSSVPEACAPVTTNLVEASLTQESGSSGKKRKKNEKKNESVGSDVSKAFAEASLTQESGTSGKKRKKEKKNESASSIVSKASLSSPVNGVLSNGSSSSCEPESDGDLLNESVIANLQKQFEDVSAELASDDNDDVFSLSDAFKSINDKTPTKKKKKTKKAKSCDTQIVVNKGNVEDSAVKSVDASAKKVRFSMKNNLVWKPHSPLPPQSLRIPPSVTPRGSALKKGVLPGPIREVPPAKKKLKKKGRKTSMKTIVPWR